MSDSKFLLIQAGIGFICFILGAAISSYKEDDKIVSIKKKLECISDLAGSFVAWADQFMKTESGEEKMEAVTDKLLQLADEIGLEIDQTTIEAIVQKAYNSFKAGKEITLVSTGVEETPAPVVPLPYVGPNIVTTPYIISPEVTCKDESIPSSVTGNSNPNVTAYNNSTE